ncbi:MULTISPECIES: chloride channel protein [unclassified Cryobacterium]|uniref:chloride channel protein n=1 Tax=unclassified Cryobacterium TaxID=2649013 RepID=UPI002AB3DE9E|nr:MULTISPECIES: chloride channel protein [unclassified Cryobacterium]MDY7528229.1 chloride channel protein [Cryobacterium sp. 10C2]MEB0002382.1 chloride channel protein [Cryobacterium sp. RTC2.1]MEB0289272.1 chloride channel protein [Cryobacterium sp. 10C2]
MRPVPNSVTPSWVARIVVVTALVGVGAGLGGLAVSVLLRAIQHLAYGYSEGTYLDGLARSAPQTRVIALCVAGVIGAVGWWAVRRWGRPIVPVNRSVAGERMPVLATLVNSALQIVIVGLGASIGREMAPRELGALAAGWLSEKAGVTARERRVLVACGAGAGLAAVYNVPLGGALFTVEILLAELTLATVLPALATSAIATLVAQIVVPTTPLYSVPQFTQTPSLLVWSLLAGPVIGFAAVGFVRLAAGAEKRRPQGWLILVVMPLVFSAIGLLSLLLPEILGNGRSLGQTAFDAVVPIGLVAVLLVAKVGVTIATIGSGAAGGTLTPSLAIGAAFGIVTGGLWGTLWPGTPVAAFALVGAAAFLGAAMRAPLTALVLVLEFTGQGPALLIPMTLAVAGAVVVEYLLGRRRFLGID